MMGTKAGKLFPFQANIRQFNLVFNGKKKKHLARNTNRGEKETKIKQILKQLQGWYITAT